MHRLVLLVILLLVGCRPSESPALPTRAPMVAPIRAELEAKPSNGDYVALSQQLAAPLGALIVALRDNSPTAPQHLASFNRAADQVSPAIARDVSIDANRLRSAIINVREAAERRDIATLERIRLQFLEVR